jgi:hypothetical protein
VTHYRDLGVPLRRILTDNDPEFVAGVFGNRVAGLGLAQHADHTGPAATNAHVERSTAPSSASSTDWRSDVATTAA